MARYQVTLAYDGTLFEGFQRQRRRPQEGRTVQGVLESALRQLNWQGRAVLAAGRTDAGVHAAGQVVAFDLEWMHSSAALGSALNASLPDDIAVQAVSEADPGFHPRYDAIARVYRYSIYCQPGRDPLRDRYAWRVWPAPELGSLQENAGLLPGTHDFAGFGSPPRDSGGTIRTVYRASWQAVGTSLIFEIMANAFLYRMVRRLVFAQVMVAQGKLRPDAIQVRVSGELNKMVQGLAPPQGLVLVEVKYT